MPLTRITEKCTCKKGIVFFNALFSLSFESECDVQRSPSVFTHFFSVVQTVITKLFVKGTVAIGSCAN